MEITYSEEIPDHPGELVELYDDAGWTAYTTDPSELLNAIRNSHYVLLAKDGGKLIGLIRTISDGVTIAYIQDILVHSDYKRLGIGSSLMRKVLTRYQGIRQKVLLADATEESRGFYESLGFHSCDKGKVVAFAILTT